MATVLPANVSIVQSAPRMSRSMRKPEHSWHLRTPPFCIQPFFIAPVLAGETLKRATMQARVVSDPVKNPLIGAWNEYYVFYVKLRDLPFLSSFDEDTTKATIEAMLLDPSADVSSLQSSTAAAWHYRAGISQLPWTTYCLHHVVEQYFRDEGENFDVAEGNLTDTAYTGYVWRMAQVNRNDALHSAVLAAEYTAPTDPGIVVGGDDTFTMSELDRAYTKWQLERQHGMTDKTFEDYQREFGVNVPMAQEAGRPELVRYIRDFTYPANTVLSGSVNSAFSWSHTESIDKDRFFREPGFLYGVTVMRPKVYFSGQTSSMSNFLQNALNWLPPRVQQDLHAPMQEFAASSGPVPGVTGSAYWVDIRDLFVYGDQFLNFALTATDAGLVALPTSTMVKRYPALADITGLFSTAANHYVRQDGIIRLEVAGTVRDLTQRT